MQGHSTSSVAEVNQSSLAPKYRQDISTQPPRLDTEREEAAKRVVEAVEERADAKRRALEEQLWEAAGQWSETAVAPLWVAKPRGRMTVGGPSTPRWRASGVQDPCTRCCNKGTLCILGTAKGKTTACKKQVQWSEETEDMEMIDIGKDDEGEEVQSHFAVPTHLTEDHQDAPGALTTTLDFLTFWQDLWDLGVAMLRAMEAIANKLQRSNDLKEEEMGKSKGKGKEKAKEEFRRSRMDDDGDMEMGGAGPSSLA
ncbi:hypothetical protein ID866_12570 [Astraeus odoratus]|nr:hypothetical protein ID866_12570 [Astraeus odoratus]